MKTFIKFIFIVAVVLFGLVNYRLLSFSKGFSNFKFDDTDAEKTIYSLISINKIEYYNNPLPNSDGYVLFVETANENYLFSGDGDDIKALSVGGVLAKNLTPNKIAPIPFWVEIIVVIVILFIPTRRRKKSE